MKKRVIRYFTCLFITFILLILCTALCKIWEGEDWIGTYLNPAKRNVVVR